MSKYDGSFMNRWKGQLIPSRWEVLMSADIKQGIMCQSLVFPIYTLRG